MLLKLKVFAGSKKEFISRLAEDKFEIHVKEQPEQNKANRRVVELLATYFSVPTGKVKIITGHKSPKKVIDISD